MVTPNTIVSTVQMPFIRLTDAAIQSVRTRAEERGKLNSRTLMGGDGNATGFTGEELVKAYVPGIIQNPENRDYDFYVQNPPGLPKKQLDILTPESFRTTFDVKSRRIKVPPRLNFDCKIPMYQVNRQKTDAYIFTAPNEQMTGGWLLGWITKEEFLKKAQLFKKGYKHPSGIVLKEDHMFITVDKLRPMAMLKSGSVK